MSQSKKTALAAVAAVSLVVTPATAFASQAVDAAENVVTDNAAVAAVEQTAGKQAVKVQGDFSFTQNALTPNELIKAVFQKAAAVLCNQESELTVAEAADWAITVSGDVQNSYTATLGELAEEDEEAVIMGCTCVSNGAGGPAAINAEVTGVPLAEIIARAVPAGNANTVTLVSEDGYQTALPLSYVMARNAVISYEVNGEDLSASVGGTNQLWIDSTAAKYFTRNIVEVKVSHEEVLPAVPGAEEAADGEYVNRPNAGISAVS